MDRRIVYMGAIPQDTDILYTNRNAMVSDGWVAQGILGTSTLFSGLNCAPTSPATMTVNVSPGCVYSQQNIDNSAYGSLSSDTTEQIVKIGISQDTVNFSCPAPATVGQSVVYLIEAAFVEEDTGAAALPYYNAENPATPWSGPNNTGVSQNQTRQNICNVQLKVGTPATTGSQTTPAPDAGYTALWAVTVANGQTTITSGNIAQVGGAPFISETLTQKISQTTADGRYAKITTVQNTGYNFALDTSGSANSIVAALSPVPSALTQGMTVAITVANSNTGATTLNLNGLGAKNVTRNGNALTGGEMMAGQNYLFSYNGTIWNLQTAPANSTLVYTGSGSTTGTANAQILATVAPSGFSLQYGDIVTFTAGNTNTGAATINVESTGAVTIKKKNTSGGLVDLASGDLTSGNVYQIIYDGTYWELNSQSFPAPSTFFQVANNLSEGVASTMRSNLGLGSAALLNTSGVLQPSNNLSEVASPATALQNLGIAQPEGGITHGRKLSWASNTTITVAASSVVLKNSAGQTVKISSPSATLNSASSGANGIDTGSVANNTEYYIWGIYNGTTFASLMSLSSTAPTLPSGYTYSTLMGCWLTDGSAHFIGGILVGNDFQFQVGNNLAALPQLASGSSGNVSTGSYTAAALAPFVPSIAVRVKLLLYSNDVVAIAAPNNSYGAVSSSTNPPPLISANVQFNTSYADFVIEGSNVYYASNGAASALSVLGFTLNL